MSGQLSRSKSTPHGQPHAHAGAAHVEDNAVLHWRNSYSRINPRKSSSDETFTPLLAPQHESAADRRTRILGLLQTSMPSMRAFIWSEFSWGASQLSKVRSVNHLVDLLRIPGRLEQFLTLGWLTCLDLFLHTFTILPLRVVYAASTAGLWWAKSLLPGVASKPAGRLSPGSVRALALDVVRGLTVCVSLWALWQFQISRIYHYIRGEAVIKTYVIFNILEVLDKLAASLGQDLQQHLYRATVSTALPFDWTRRKSIVHAARIVGFILGTAVYTVLHSCILFVQIVCFSVAINSRSNSLLTLLISNNFMELKGSVFKKFELEQLFQISCADAVERFQLGVFIFLIWLQQPPAASAYGWTFLVTVLAAELLVDYVKHSFVCKFNRLPVSSYAQFGNILGHDILATKLNASTVLDPTHARTRRLGLATMPLACVLMRLGHQWAAPKVAEHSSGAVWGLAALAWLVLLCSKLLVSWVLLRWAYSRVLKDPVLLRRLHLLPPPSATNSHAGEPRQGRQPQSAEVAGAGAPSAQHFPTIPESGAPELQPDSSPGQAPSALHTAMPAPLVTAAHDSGRLAASPARSPYFADSRDSSPSPSSSHAERAGEGSVVRQRATSWPPTAGSPSTHSDALPAAAAAAAACTPGQGLRQRTRPSSQAPASSLYDGVFTPQSSPVAPRSSLMVSPLLLGPAAQGR